MCVALSLNIAPYQSQMRQKDTSQLDMYLRGDRGWGDTLLNGCRRRRITPNDVPRNPANSDTARAHCAFRILEKPGGDGRIHTSFGGVRGGARFISENMDLWVQISDV